jgi:O-antigen biosynthesis protein WbqP
MDFHLKWVYDMYLIIKRAIDIILSLVGIIILLPLFLVLSIAIKADSRGNILFKQNRIGIYKTHFNILKFRTMKMNTPKDKPTHLLKNPELYITKLGKFLRTSSLDEIPQILNIFVGNMSIIGPRPALWNQYDLIRERDKYGANDIRPGLTGWAQINGRDVLSIEDKARLDGEYVQRIGFAMDMRVFVGTISNVLGRYGIVEGGTSTSEDENIPAVNEPLTDQKSLERQG